MGPYSGGSGGGMPWWAGLGGIGAGLAGMFGTKNPANSAMPYLQNIPGQISPYFNPYIQAGQGALGALQGQYGQLLSNPGGVMNKMGAGYQQSPGYQFQVDQGMNAINRAAAAGGMLGTPQEMQQASTMNQGIANQDYYNYLNHVMGMYGQGLQGEQGIAQMGQQSAGDLASMLAANQMNMGNLAYAGQQNQNQSFMGGLGSLFGGIGSLASAFF